VKLALAVVVHFRSARSAVPFFSSATSPAPVFHRSDGIDWGRALSNRTFPFANVKRHDEHRSAGNVHRLLQGHLLRRPRSGSHRRHQEAAGRTPHRLHLRPDPAASPTAAATVTNRSIVSGGVVSALSSASTGMTPMRTRLGFRAEPARPIGCSQRPSANT
jgi:hypothetical protein